MMKADLENAVIMHEKNRGPLTVISGKNLADYFCKRLPSHTGQDQACSRFTWLFVWLLLFVTMPKMAEYTDK